MHSKQQLIGLTAIAAVVFALLLPCPLLAADAEKVLHSFTGGDGSIPYPAVIFDAKGNLYGTTALGGASGAGAVFELIPSNGKWTEKVLHSFNGQDGAEPFASLIFDAKGNLYGTTEAGGANGDGTVFELTSSKGSWTETTLYNFNGQDGNEPEGGVVFDAKGNLYGTTTLGGTYDDGTVFELTSSGGKWTERVLHNFNPSGKDALFPEASVVFDSNGNLYGTTYGGGANGAGTVFELTPTSKGAWTAKVLHSFNLNGKDGIVPEAALIFDAKGNLYGTTSAGGTNNEGTVFELTPSNGKWTEKVLYSFSHSGGSVLFSGITFDAKGNLYGSTYAGGKYSYGTVFELTPANGKWAEQVLHSFDPNNGDGLLSTAGVAFDKKGNLYGTTYEGGASGNGVVFEISPQTDSLTIP
jgi:uncharacterized repeat protein (TIGR03803 family)